MQEDVKKHTTISKLLEIETDFINFQRQVVSYRYQQQKGVKDNNTDTQKDQTEKSDKMKYFSEKRRTQKIKMINLMSSN